MVLPPAQPCGHQLAVQAWPTGFYSSSTSQSLLQRGSFNPSYDKIFSHLQHVKYKGEGSLDACSMLEQSHLRQQYKGWVLLAFSKVRASGC